MALRVASMPLAGSLATVAGCGGGSGSRSHARLSFETSASPGFRQGQSSRLVAVRAKTEEQEDKALTGVVFEPLREVQNQFQQLQKNPGQSLARQRYQVSCESGINDQINVEYNVSYVYHALFAYFDRDNLALPGLAKYFQESSVEERGHAQRLMTYQNERGGRVKLQSIMLPPMEFANEDKGDALYAMELSLSLEKLAAEKLYGLYKVAEDAHDVQLSHVIKSELLTARILSIQKVSKFVAQLRRIGNDGHGVHYWDQELLEHGA